MLSIFITFILLLSQTTSTSTSNIHKAKNIIIILTDDLDLTLGGSDTLHQTKHFIASQGATLPNWFVHTPVCCPSRSELLTGRMFHNLKLKEGTSTGQHGPSLRRGRKSKNDNDEERDNHDESVLTGCMHVNVTSDIQHPFYSQYYFSNFFSTLKNYSIGVFGKHLNNQNPSRDGTPPLGIDRWLVNGGGQYINPTFDYWTSSDNRTMESIRFDNCSTTDDGTKKKIPCYTTSIVGNASIHWIQDHLSRNRNNDQKQEKQPFFAYISVKAPHIQDSSTKPYPRATPAPWYQGSVGVDAVAPRTPNYNASCPHHHWLVRNQPPLSQEEGVKVDELFRSRLETLKSVDDLVGELMGVLEEEGVLEDTYVMFTSDHGYQLGQFRLPMGKFHPYEHDIRVPLWIRGPGIPAGSILSDVLGTHVDIMPTLWGLASRTASNDKNNTKDLVTNDEVILPSTMDGMDLSRDILQLEDDEHDDDVNKKDFHPFSTVSHSRPLQQRQQKQTTLRKKRTHVLIEYIGLHHVVRYNHLVDNYNNTFRALRIMDPPTIATTTNTTLRGRRNWKFVEYTDFQMDPDYAKENDGEPYREYEFFDLDRDPYEMENIVQRVEEKVVDGLKDEMDRLYSCAGASCRYHDDDYFDDQSYK